VIANIETWRDGAIPDNASDEIRPGKRWDSSSKPARGIRESISRTYTSFIR